jgi:hypothetical protein
VEALDLLSDYGPKLFSSSFPKYIKEVRDIIAVPERVSPNLAYVLRQVVLNFSYEMPGKIISKPEVLHMFISVILSALVVSIDKDS